MSKSPSIARKNIYLIELIAVGLCTALILGLTVVKVVALVKQPTLPPSVDIQQLELQKAIKVIDGTMPN